MSTIQALAVFGMWLGFGVFGLSVISLIFSVKWSVWKTKVALQQMGYLPALRWKFLMIGIISLIVKNTI